MDNGNIRWDQPIEAVHEDGRVAPATLIRENNGEGLVYCSETSDDGRWFYRDGSSWEGWTIRNVVEAKAVEAPETHRQGTNGVRTGVEALERLEGLYERMAAHLRDCAQAHNVRPRDTEAQRRYDEMKAIVALLPEPVDPDLVEAREIMARLYPVTAEKIRNGDWDNNAVRDCLEGLKRGRALERGEN